MNATQPSKQRAGLRSGCTCQVALWRLNRQGGSQRERIEMHVAPEDALRAEDSAALAEHPHAAVRVVALHENPRGALCGVHRRSGHPPAGE